MQSKQVALLISFLSLVSMEAFAEQRCPWVVRTETGQILSPKVFRCASTKAQAEKTSRRIKRVISTTRKKTTGLVRSYLNLPGTGEVYTVDYIYEHQACGTLSTDYSAEGSVRLGRGPVYERAKAVCAINDPALVPDDFSVGVAACSEQLAPDNTTESVSAHAIFYFRCTTRGQQRSCEESDADTTPDYAWHCEGISQGDSENAN